MRPVTVRLIGYGQEHEAAVLNSLDLALNKCPLKMGMWTCRGQLSATRIPKSRAGTPQNK